MGGTSVDLGYRHFGIDLGGGKLSATRGSRCADLSEEHQRHRHTHGYFGSLCRCARADGRVRIDRRNSAFRPHNGLSPP